MFKQLSGDVKTAQEYMNRARGLLNFVKYQQGLLGISMHSKRVQLPNGVVISASSRFGIDQVQIYAPQAAVVDMSEWCVMGGYCMDADWNSHAVLWDVNGKLTDLGIMPGAIDGGVYGVGLRGTVAVGSAAFSHIIPGHAFSNKAFRWEQGYDDLGLLGGAFSARATGVSTDGSVVVGYGSVPPGGNVTDSNGNTILVPGTGVPFYWTREKGLVILGTDSGVASAISGDGSTAVGGDNDGAWWKTISGTQVGVADGPRSIIADGGVATGVSYLGDTVVGATFAGIPYIWSALRGRVLLPGGTGAANGVSDDGTVVGSVGVGYKAVYWSDGQGAMKLTVLGSGIANAISRDGSRIVGASFVGGVHAPVWWEQDGTMHTLEILPGGVPYGEVTCIDMGRGE